MSAENNNNSDTLSAIDSRTGKEYILPIADDTIPATKLREIKVNDDDFGMLSYDPALKNTVTCKSSICFIDGEKGILEYRGYPIEETASKGTYLEICWLLLNGELPTAAELDMFEAEIKAATYAPEDIQKLHDVFNKNLHPMAMLESALAALGGEFDDVDDVLNAESRHQQIIRLIALTPVLAAMGYRHRNDLGPVEVNNDLSYSSNFLHMMLSRKGREDEIHPALEKAMDALLILHADHEQNCSANAMRAVASSQVNPYSSAAAAASALHGPLHGGANQAVLEMLDQIDSVDDVPAFLESCKNGERRLMGFGHRVYKNYDPRAKVIGDLASAVFDVVGHNPKLDIARALEKAAIEDDYFSSRKLFPNVDFYSGLIYSAMGFDPRMFTVFFAVGRMVGWLAHWNEMMADTSTKIVRPRQIYTGYGRRDWVDSADRK
ncbi:MAG: citrate (Si)-synthase [Planctomycetes bacterium]|nr:citrate (Si)-synthase [Planctomycetota bacterium]